MVSQLTQQAATRESLHAAKEAAYECAYSILGQLIEGAAELKRIVAEHNAKAAQRHRQSDAKRPSYISAASVLKRAARAHNLPSDMAAAIADASFYAKEPPKPRGLLKATKTASNPYVSIPKAQRASERRGQLLRHSNHADTWLIRAFVGRVEGRKRYLSEVVRGSQQEAERMLTELLEFVKARPVLDLGPMTFTEYAREHYLPDVESKLLPKTYEGYKWMIEARVTPFLGRRRMKNLSRRSLEQLEAELKMQGIAPAVAERAAAATLRVLRHASANGAAVRLLVHPT